MTHVIVVGAGNAALCAALSAREHGAEVTVLEKAPEGERGGNTYFTGGGFRFPYEGMDDIRRIIPDLSAAEIERVDVGAYPAAQFRDDLARVTDGLIDDGMASTLVREAAPTIEWLHGQGVKFTLMTGRQANEVDGKLVFYGGLTVEAVGAGKGLSDQEFEAAERVGVNLRYGAKVVNLLRDRRRICGVELWTEDEIEELQADAVVLAAGGFEANIEMRTRYLGPGWDMAKVRGSRFNTGDAIQAAIDAGAQPFGNWSGAHAVAWDLNAPPTGNRIVADLYQKHSYPYGLIVNVDGERFVDEGADIRNYTYAKYGRAILSQPERAAFQLFDQRTAHLLRDEYHVRQVTMAQADTIGELAESLGVDVDGLQRTIDAYNQSCPEHGVDDFNPSMLDGVATRGVSPPKSNWALPFDSPPYLGYAVTCGITFTFGGLKIDPSSGQVLDTEDRPMTGLYAAGELVGGLFYNNYAGGSGLMAGSVFGRIAGRSAANASR
ncbi:MAG: FAD-dependent tricarballylate dehydrogenase TcuA [Chloroflexota bacterium]|nr:FAD-dependent tricarballylate dehydrogenase TcuA [Chloroflexota bacterium]MDE2895206.1 FAD-dependent tricarballylate dehydrogenase TcuA [Chloroflexota bacterium]